MKTCLIKNVNEESKYSMSNIMVTYYDAVDHELENKSEKTFLNFFQSTVVGGLARTVKTAFNTK